MGVKGLWAVLEAASVRGNLAQLANDSFEATPGLRSYRAGVDVSIWIRVSISSGFLVLEQAPDGACSSSKLIRRRRTSRILRTVTAPAPDYASFQWVLCSAPVAEFIWYRLVHLLAANVVPLFVFDGPDVPALKRGISTKTKGSSVEHAVKELLDAFGVAWVTASGEAEAELAEFTRCDLIDAVITVRPFSLCEGWTAAVELTLSCAGRRRCSCLWSSHLASPSFFPLSAFCGALTLLA